MPRRGYGYHHNNTGASTKPTKPMIYWDQGISRYIIKVPFSDTFRNRLQVMCSTATYLGKSEGAWSIIEDDLRFAKPVVGEIFGEFDFIEKPQEEFKIVSSAANQAALTMFKVAGYDRARKCYSLLINELHPDRNPDPKEQSKCAEITVAWKELKKELGW